ncbi:hypothetical protein GQ44DRAFT_201771 [Phaeosphaeriaceae sp. PMI808]|nr:hypothetical protein GQ44DRAFT_201771 [Phaeosphaeriaceae sp. PMI808]
MPECPPDSPLSMTGNIVGILTFALAIFSFCAAIFAITNNAPQEIKDCEEYLKELKGHIQEIDGYFKRLNMEADRDLERNSIKELVSGAIYSLKTRLDVTGAALSNIRGRWHWWYCRQGML